MKTEIASLPTKVKNFILMVIFKFEVLMIIFLFGDFLSCLVGFYAIILGIKLN